MPRTMIWSFLRPHDHGLAVVDERQVPGAEPALLVVPLLIGRLVVEVPGHDGGSGDAQLAHPAFGQHLSEFVDDADAHPGDRAADPGEHDGVLVGRVEVADGAAERGRVDGDGARRAVPQALAGVGDARARLGHAPARDHRVGGQPVRGEEFQEPVAGRRDHRLTGVDDVAQVRQVPGALADLRGPLVDQCHGEVGRPGAGHAVAVGPVEPQQRVGQEVVDLGVDVQALQEHVAHVVVGDRDVVERHPDEADVVACHPAVLDDRERPGHHAGMGVLHTLGHPGAARGEQVEHRRVGRCREPVRVALVPGEFLDGQDAYVRLVPQLAHPGQRGRGGGVGDQDRAAEQVPGAAQLAVRLVLGGVRHGDGHRCRQEAAEDAGPERGEIAAVGVEDEQRGVPGKRPAARNPPRTCWASSSSSA